MNDLIWIAGFGLSAFLIIYHHVGYPLLLKWLPLKPKSNDEGEHFAERHYKASARDNKLPSVTIIIPAYNEEQWIAEKIRNLASLDYPRDKLKVVIACDGCSDKTAEIAQDTIQEAICSDTLFIVNDHSINRGKVALINEEMKHVTSDITALSDTSALVSCDSLLLASQHYQNEKVGVVNATYQIMRTSNQAKPLIGNTSLALNTKNPYLVQRLVLTARFTRSGLSCLSHSKLAPSMTISFSL